MTVLKCLWGLEAHISQVHFWHPPWGWENQFLRPPLHFKNHFYVLCPYDSIQVLNLRVRLFIFTQGFWIFDEDSICVAWESAQACENSCGSYFLHIGHKIILRGPKNKFTWLCQRSCARSCNNSFNFEHFCIFRLFDFTNMLVLIYSLVFTAT